MSAKNSGILDNQWTVLSVVEPEYSGLIFPEEPIPPVKPIPPEEPIPPVKILDNQWATVSPVESAYEGLIFPEEPITPLGSIFPVGSTFGVGPISIDIMPPIEFINPVNWVPYADPIPPKDPLTGIVNNPTVNTPPPKKVTSLHNAQLDINLSTGIPDHARVTATVRVELSKTAIRLIEDDEVDFILQSSLWGIDGNLFNGDNDNLFYFDDQEITKEGTYTFSKIVHLSDLDEDHSWVNDTDEISASISLVCFEPLVPLNIQTMTPIWEGKF
jgi:hypothetical protein